MTKLREIIERYAEHIKQTNEFAKFQSIPKFISSDDFDKLEKELIEYIKYNKDLPEYTVGSHDVDEYYTEQGR